MRAQLHPYVCFPALLAAFASFGWAQPVFDSGSTGADGPLFITANTTMDLPPSGVFNFTSVSVAQGVTLKFNRNSLNTPVYMLATEDISIAGTIDVSGQPGNDNPPVAGKGGPGGYDGGQPGDVGNAPGAGLRPGGGKGGDATNGNTDTSCGQASYGTAVVPASAKDGPIYGTPLLVPLLGGSGGGGRIGTPGLGGSGGGGAILLASNTRITISGSILAHGGNESSGGLGSGGAVRCVAPMVAGAGTLNVQGGAYGNFFAGAGRVRIDTLNRDELNYTYVPATVPSIGNYMLVFPAPLPRLDIIQVAGHDIVEGTPESISVFLPVGTNPNQMVRVQARDFIGLVPIRLQLTPQNGDPLAYDAAIQMTTNPKTIDVPVVLPVNTITYIHVWTR